MACLCIAFLFRIQICSSEERVQRRHWAGFPPGFLWDAASPGEWRNARWGSLSCVCWWGWKGYGYRWLMDLNPLGITESDMPRHKRIPPWSQVFPSSLLPSWRMAYASLSSSCSQTGWRSWRSVQFRFSKIMNALLEQLILSRVLPPCCWSCESLQTGWEHPRRPCCGLCWESTFTGMGTGALLFAPGGACHFGPFVLSRPWRCTVPPSINLFGEVGGKGLASVNAAGIVQVSGWW